MTVLPSHLLHMISHADRYGFIHGITGTSALSVAKFFHSVLEKIVVGGMVRVSEVAIWRLEPRE